MSAIVRTVHTWRVVVPQLPEMTASPVFGPNSTAIDSRMIIRIRDSDGFEGWGEGLAVGDDLLEETFAPMPGKPLQDYRPAFLDLWPSGKHYFQRPVPPSPYAADPALLQHRLRHPLQVPVEMALCDLLAKRAAMPLNQLWGGAWGDRVPVDYWMTRVMPDQAQAVVRKGKELGFTGIKLKTTLEDPNVDRLVAIRDVAPDWRVTVDANGRFYRLDDSFAVLQEMDRVGNVAILEDPFPRFHLEEFAELRRRVDARVVVHIDPPESLWNVLTSDAAGGLNIDGSAGLYKWRMQAAVAEQANLPIWQGSGLDLGIATAAQLHLSASAPNCTLPGDQAGPWVRESHLLKDDFRVEEGHVLIPEGTGSGVEVDLDAVDKYCTGSFSWG